MERSEKEEAERAMQQLDQERHKSRNAFQNMSAEDIVKRLEDKYKSTPVNDVDLDDDFVMDDISQTSLLPQTKDPNLWIVKCRMGEEKLVALQLMRKFIAYQSMDEPLQIKSVVCKEGLKGMIYIEAYKQTHVQYAIEGISALNSYNIAMVPIKDMVDSLRVTKDIPHLRTGSYVRLKRTLYKDDLAQVDWVDVAQNKVNLKLVPRVDYNKMRGALRTEADKNYKRTRRPFARLFDLERIKEIGGEVTNDGDFITFEGNNYRRGFLYKSFPMNAIIVDGVKPSLTELEKFQESADDLQKELETTTVREKGHSFAPGDVVEVVEGELVNLKGKVESVDGEKIIMMPEHEDLKEPLTLNAWELRKFFKAGDHIKILSGDNEGNTGLIVRVEPNLIVVLSDLSMNEMKIRPRDARLCADVSTGIDSLGRFRFHDLVQLDQQTVGVIVRIEKEALEVLNMHGKVVRIKPQAIMCKKESKFSIALDRDGNQLSVKDIVKVVDGPYAAKKDNEEMKQGEIKHLYRSFAFVYMRQYTENGGIFVCKPKHLLLVGGSNNKSNMPNIARLGSATPNPFASPRHPGLGGASPATNAGKSVRGNQTPGTTVSGFGTAENNRVRRDTSLIGKTVRVTQGPLKGYVGIVKDATDTTVRVELHTQCKTISVDRSRVKIVGEGLGTAGSMSVYTKTPSHMADSSKTPMYQAGKTPLYQGAMTPMYGSQTPGGRTPHYGAQTPHYADGGRTPAYTDGGRTPAYNESGRTPAYDPASRTPAYEGNQTPAYIPKQERDSSDDEEEEEEQEPKSPTYDQPPSPQYSVPTPGTLLNPSTPGYMPDTPMGNYNPMTPGNMYDYSAPSPYVRPYDQGSRDQAVHTIPTHFLRTGEWIVEDMIVLIRANDDRSLNGREAVVQNILDENKCDLYVPDLRKNVEIPFEQVVPIKPEIGDTARVIFGDEMGAVGELISSEGTEGVIKVLDSNDMKLAPLEFCCKMRQ
ncbi:hypothetical protein WR25_00956 isoform B [Diploscapter pachys]|nr:hypothetical protein WR25_00956 isoform B [Diploscapter pachys]